MTQKVGIITDSLSCLPPELLAQYQIEILPINLYFGDRVYKDWVDITPSQAYELFLKDTGRFSTSAPSPMDCLEAYRKVGQRAENILCVTVSAELSMVYESSLLAGEQARTELPGVNIAVLNSKTVTAAEGFVALAGARAAEEGKSLTEVVKAAEEIRDKVNMVAVLDTVRHVYRSGRVPKVAAQAGSILNLRPILTVSGKVHFIGVARNKEQGINRILRKMRGEVGQGPAHVAVMHAYALDEAEKLKERVASEFNCAELWVTEFSPVMGYACGTGLLGLAYYGGG